MSRLTSFATHRVELVGSPHGPEWVEVRNQLSYEEDQALVGALFDAAWVDGVYRAQARVGQKNPALLHAYVAGWQLWDDDGSPIPFSQDALRRLDTDTAEILVAHINDWVQAADMEKKVTPTSPSET